MKLGSCDVAWCTIRYYQTTIESILEVFRPGPDDGKSPSTCLRAFPIGGLCPALNTSRMSPMVKFGYCGLSRRSRSARVLQARSPGKITCDVSSLLLVAQFVTNSSYSSVLFIFDMTHIGDRIWNNIDNNHIIDSKKRLPDSSMHNEYNGVSVVVISIQLMIYMWSYVILQDSWCTITTDWYVLCIIFIIRYYILFAFINTS